jgi:hypothetical protein
MKPFVKKKRNLPDTLILLDTLIGTVKNMHDTTISQKGDFEFGM